MRRLTTLDTSICSPMRFCRPVRSCILSTTTSTNKTELRRIRITAPSATWKSTLQRSFVRMSGLHIHPMPIPATTDSGHGWNRKSTAEECLEISSNWKSESPKYGKSWPRTQSENGYENFDHDCRKSSTKVDGQYNNFLIKSDLYICFVIMLER